MHKTFVKSNSTNLFDAVKTIVLNLPTEQRQQLVKEVQDQEWQTKFTLAHNAISKKLKAAGLTANDVPRMIKEAREAALNETKKA